MEAWEYARLPPLTFVRYIPRPMDSDPSRIYIRQRNGYTYRLSLEPGSTIIDVVDWITKKQMTDGSPRTPV